MSINAIDPHMKPIPGVQGLKESTPKVGGQKSGGGSFGDVFEKAMSEVNDMQNQADKQIEGLALKSEGVTPHGAMVALEKADIAFQLMSAIRGKIIRAYEEVIRTQV